MTIREKSGFTLIELLIVIAIIAILAGIIIATLGNPTAEARNTARVQAVDSIADAAQQYLMDNAAYSATQAALATGGFISQVPVDPLTSRAIRAYTYLNCMVSGRPRVVIAALLETAKGATEKADSDMGAATWDCDAAAVCDPAAGSQSPAVCPVAAGAGPDCSGALVYCVSR